MKKKIGLNGFGRFGLHLLKYWLDRMHESNFEISYINDDSLNINKLIHLIKKDKYINFSRYKLKNQNDKIIFIDPEGTRAIIKITNHNSEKISWIGKPDFFFECSGKNTSKKDCKCFLKKNTKLVIISSTSWDADKTLIYGYNHHSFLKSHKIISYGSCTVNAYIPFHIYLSKKYKIINSDVNVIHNTQEYKLSNFNTLLRKFCTLEKSGVDLLKDINKDNFAVNYTLVPYSGVSMIDFRFQFKNKLNKKMFIDYIYKGCVNGDLNGLYNFIDKDVGPNKLKETIYSAVFIKDKIKIVGNQVYLQAYFDNENSANRFYDLSNYLCKKFT